MHPKPGAIISNKYKLIQSLAYGGMGCIWTARHETLDTKLAVKFIHPVHLSSSELRGRFAREAVASARINSPHVVQVFDYGIEDDTPYLVMELLEGEDLGARLKREMRLSLEVTCNILIQVAKGLRRAHGAGIIHRDLKPANIFLARDGDEEVVKILDFGIAKLASSPEWTGIGQLMGSPMYMSPEQIQQRQNVDHRADLWSLAVILFRAITGKAPFTGDDSATVLINVVGDSVPVPSQIDPSLPTELDAFFVRAFKREPSERFQSARELTDAFVEAALGEPPSASSWSVIGLYIGPRCTPLPVLSSPAPDPMPVTEPLTLTAPLAAPAPVSGPVQNKTLPSAMPLVERSGAAERGAWYRPEKTISIRVPAPPPRRTLGSFIPWHVVFVSTLIGFGIGWQVLPGTVTPAALLEQGASVAARTGIAMLRGLTQRHDDAAAGAPGEPPPHTSVSQIRPLDEPHSVLANDSVPAATRIAAPGLPPHSKAARPQ
ncbi:MAG: protein kinase [Polyangiaceae bacterium]|nr:protein kinase [Polyangiaceae bacterium]